jgi:autotransporter-associated beta strand protein
MIRFSRPFNPGKLVAVFAAFMLIGSIKFAVAQMPGAKPASTPAPVQSTPGPVVDTSAPAPVVPPPQAAPTSAPQVTSSATTPPPVSTNPTGAIDAPNAILANGTWTANAAGNWSTTTNWSGGTVADGAGSTADFSTINITAGRKVTIDTTSRTVGTLLVGDSTTAFNAYTFASTGGATLTFNNSGGGAVLTQTANTGSNIFDSTLALVLGDNLTINNNAATGTTARSLTISGGITGAFNLTLNANGTNSNDITLDTTSINNGGSITNSGTGTGTVTISSNIGTNVTGLAQSSSTSAFTISGNVALGTDMTLTSNGTKLTTISGVISGAHSFTIGGNGTGTTTLSGNNTFSNGLTLNSGILNINSSGTSATNSAIGTGTFTINGGTIRNTSGGTVTLATNNAQTWGGDFTFDGGSSPTTNNLNLGTGAVTLTGNRQITVSGNTSTLTVGGAIGDGGSNFNLTKTAAGAGTLILTGTSTYGGGTTIGNGAISVSNIGNAGANGNLGTGNITLGSGTATGNLLYTGTGETTSKVINLGGTTGGGRLDQSGTGLLKFTADLTATGSGNKTLTLQGSSAGTGEFAGKITDSAGGTTSVLKSGTGTWTISNSTNNFTGSTTISASGGTLIAAVGTLVSTSGVTVNSGGTLLLSGNGRHIGANAPITLAGGTFATGGFSEPNGGASGLATSAIGALTLTATSTIDFGSSNNSILEFAGLGAHTPTTGPDLLITNWNGNPLLGGTGDRLLFIGLGTDFVTKYSQSDVTFNNDAAGYAIIQFDIAGNPYYEVTAIPEPSTWIGGALTVAALGWSQRRRFAQLVKRAA